MPLIILGGIYSGLFTPTEAATVSVVYAIIIGLFVYKEMKLKDIPKIFWNAAKSSGGILMIITCAATFATILTRNNILNIIGNYTISVASARFMFYLMFSVFMFLLGMVRIACSGYFDAYPCTGGQSSRHRSGSFWCGVRYLDVHRHGYSPVRHRPVYCMRSRKNRRFRRVQEGLAFCNYLLDMHSSCHGIPVDFIGHTAATRARRIKFEAHTLR